MHILTAQQWDATIEITGGSAIWRYAACDFCSDVFNSLVSRNANISEARMYDGLAEGKEGFKLASLGGHRRINRRATRIQLRLDFSLLLNRRDREMRVEVVGYTEILDSGRLLNMGNVDA